MAATSGTAIFRGAQTGKTYVIDLYLSDTANGLVNFDSGGGASANSQTFYTAPENIILEDVSIVTGAAQTRVRICANNRPTQHLLRQTVHLTTLNNRPQLSIGFAQGTQISMIQIA